MNQILTEAEALLVDLRARRETSGLFFLSARTGQVGRFGADEDGAVRATDLQGAEFQKWIKALAGKTTSGLTAQGAYQRVAPVFQAIEIRTGALAGVPYTLENKSGKTVFDSDPLKNIPLPDELEFLEALPVLFDLSEAALSLVGKVRIHKEHPAGKAKIDNLRWYNPLTITVKDKDYEVIDERSSDKVLRYTRETSGEDDTIDAENMLAIDRPDPFVERGPGTPPLHPALEGAKVLEALVTFLSGHLATGMVKNLFFTLKDPSGEGRPLEGDGLQKFKADIFNWLKRRGKIERVSDVKALTEHTGIHEVGEGIKDLSDKELSNDYWRWVAGAFNIPLGLMLERAANYATYMGQLYQLYTFTIFKDCRLIERAFNKDLLKDMGFRLQFQYRRVEAVQWAEMQKAASAQMLTGGVAIITPEQARELYGLWPENQMPNAETVPPTNGAATGEEAQRIVTVTR